MSYAVGQMEKLFQSYSRNGKRMIYYYGYMIVLFQCNTTGSTVELHYQLSWTHFSQPTFYLE